MLTCTQQVDVRQVDVRMIEHGNSSPYGSFRITFQ
jgi:hypothetical protein